MNRICSSTLVCSFLLQLALVSGNITTTLYEKGPVVDEYPPIEQMCLRDSDTCIDPTTITCSDTKYRSLSGACNNDEDPTLGMQFTTYKRLLPANYADDISAMRTAANGNPLPSARLLSSKAFGGTKIPDKRYTALNGFFSQLITYDTSTRFADGVPGLKPLPMKEQTCCSADGQLEVRNMTSICSPIEVPANDSVFANRQCLAFDRSLTDKDQACPDTDDPASVQQLNGVTHYLDMSFIYGSSNSQSNRELSGGLLKTKDVDKKFPPQSQFPEVDCANGAPDEPCYDFGDVRGNRNPAFTALSIVFYREHNRLATELANLNPHWDDERLFQEARRINIAQFQHIVYFEWALNQYGAWRMMKTGVITWKPNGEYVNDYDPCADPRSIQEFQYASFRNTLNQIVETLQLVPENRRLQNDTVVLSDVLNRPGFLEVDSKLDSLLRGLATQNSVVSDSGVDVEGVIAGAVSARDLKSFDIQRGRDHGLQTYNDVRVYCGLRRANNWTDYLDTINNKEIQKLRQIYESHEDVDLVVGGALERNLRGLLVGPTFLCINLKQFKDWRKGDKYFYENGEQPYPFTPGQLKEIRNRTIAGIICDNTNIQTMQPKAFRAINRRNSLTRCKALRKLNLAKWKDAQPILHWELNI